MCQFDINGNCILGSPLQVPQTKTKNFILNLNVYRNAHYFTLNKAKVNYTAHMEDQIKTLPMYDRVRIKYQLYPKTHHMTDLDNVLSVHQKFFQDALTKFNKIPDDTYKHITTSVQLFGEVDPTNPRVEITIIPI